MLLKKNTLKTAFAENNQTYGSWVTLSHPLIPEIMSQAGFDWLCIDMEHSSIELRDILPLVISIENNEQQLTLCLLKYNVNCCTFLMCNNLKDFR